MLFIANNTYSGELSSDNQLTLPSADINAPEMSHTPPSVLGDDGGMQFSAIVTDDRGVKSVVLYYRERNSQHFLSKSMQRRLSDSDTYVVSLSKDDISHDGIEYYIKAEDVSGNTLLHGYSFAPIILGFESGKAAIISDPLNTTTLDKSVVSKKNTPLWKNKWLWIGVGAVVVSVASTNRVCCDSEPPPKPTVTVPVISPPLE